MSFFRAIATVGSLTLLSRIAGFARDILMAAILGAGAIADAFFVALKLPNVFRRITAEGAFSVSFVPMFSGIEETKGRAEAMRFAAEAQSLMATILLPFVALVIYFMPQVIGVITPGFVDDPERFDLAVELGRVTFSYIFLISLVALYGGVLNSFNRFAAFAVAPVFFNLTLIAALLFLTPYSATPAHALAYGVTISGVIQLLWMLGNAYRFKLVIKCDLPKITARIKRLFRLMGPAILGAGVVQINLVIDLLLASFLKEGSISYLYYADRLYQLPLSVIGIAIGTALLPMLARKLKGVDMSAARDLMRQGIKFGLIFAIPAMAALIILSDVMMVTLFERGAFDRTASLAASLALIAYAVSLPAFILVKIFSTMFFAQENTKTPVKIAICATVINTLFGIILIQYFDHVGIAMATAIAAWVHIGCLVVVARKVFTALWQGMGAMIFKIIVSTIVMAASLFWVQAIVPETIMASSLSRIIYLAALVGGGAIIYFVILITLKTINRADLRLLVKKGS